MEPASSPPTSTDNSASTPRAIPDEEARQRRAEELELLKQEIRAELPKVRGTSTQELATRIHSGASGWILIDARAMSEYEVSHLPGAIRAETSDAALALLEGEPRDLEVIVYCSVGYRSAYLARDLMRAGYENVKNFEGSIFEWANTGHTLVSNGKTVNEVHPYDRKWGRLLAPELWSAID